MTRDGAGTVRFLVDTPTSFDIFPRPKPDPRRLFDLRLFPTSDWTAEIGEKDPEKSEVYPNVGFSVLRSSLKSLRTNKNIKGGSLVDVCISRTTKNFFVWSWEVLFTFWGLRRHETSFTLPKY